MKNKRVKLNKIISMCLAFVMVIGCFSYIDTSYAKTREIFLDVQMDDRTDGPDDMVMYRFDCQQSGMYTFYQLSVRSLEGYLFIKEQMPDGSKRYTQLAFSNSNPNYNPVKYPGSRELGFSLTYHLEEGKTYYFGTLAPYGDATPNVSVSVMLHLDNVDAELIDHIEAKCDASLKWYTDGDWRVDNATKKQYFHYNISKLITNTTITVYYTDGTVKSATGVDKFDGIDVMYKENQHENHWYIKSDPNYTSNDFTIKILNKSVTLNVNIEEGALFPVKGRVVDYSTNEPIKDAEILLNSSSVAKTDANGNFAFTSAPGNFTIIVNFDNSITNESAITVASNVNQNDYTSTPYKLITCDFVDDDVINTKDSAFVNNSTMAEEIKNAKLLEIDKLLGANKDTYK